MTGQFLRAPELVFWRIYGHFTPASIPQDEYWNHAESRIGVFIRWYILKCDRKLQKLVRKICTRHEFWGIRVEVFSTPKPPDFLKTMTTTYDCVSSIFAQFFTCFRQPECNLNPPIDSSRFWQSLSSIAHSKSVRTNNSLSLNLKEAYHDGIQSCKHS